MEFIVSKYTVLFNWLTDTIRDASGKSSNHGCRGACVGICTGSCYGVESGDGTGNSNSIGSGTTMSSSKPGSDNSAYGQHGTI